MMRSLSGQVEAPKCEFWNSSKGSQCGNPLSVQDVAIDHGTISLVWYCLRCDKSYLGRHYTMENQLNNNYLQTSASTSQEDKYQRQQTLFQDLENILGTHRSHLSWTLGEAVKQHPDFVSLLSKVEQLASDVSALRGQLNTVKSDVLYDVRSRIESFTLENK